MVSRDEDFWRKRLQKADEENEPLHKVIYNIDEESWSHIQWMSSQILLACLPKDGCTLLDVGCGFGSLVDCLPGTYKVEYTGIDLVPEFVRVAQLRFPEKRFFISSYRNFQPEKKFNFVVARSMREMLREHEGLDAEKEFLSCVSQLADQSIFIEYGNPKTPKSCWLEK